MMTVGEALVAGLVARGVEVVFGIPGVHTIELYRGLAGGSLRHVTARHEQGAGFMADGYARVSGKPGVAIVITGPGLTNTMTAIAQARSDSVPMLVISGVNRRETLGRGYGFLHELPDQARLMSALCPTERIEHPEDVGPALDRAFARMLSQRPGPAHIEVPLDVMAMMTQGPAAPIPFQRPGLGPEVVMRQALNLLDEADHLVILAGGGARAAKLEELAEALDAPVVLTANARGQMHDHLLSVPASPSLKAVRALLADADTVLALGTELGPTDYDVFGTLGLPETARMIRVDTSHDQLTRSPVAVGIHGDAAAVTDWLTRRLKWRKRDGAARALQARTEARSELSTLHPSYSDQLAVVETIQRALPEAIIVGDSTQPIYAANLYYDHARPNGWFNAATGYGALGYAPGAAIGAAIAAPGTPVICVIGDGGLQFTATELRTAVDENLPITFIVWNNASYREIAEAMEAARTRVIGCTPSPLNLPDFAAACDLPFASVDPEVSAMTFQLNLGTDRPRLIEIRAK